MIVDGQNLLMRAIFAAKGSNMSSDGVATGPLVIFINSLAKHVQQERPERLLVVWDGGTSPHRLAILPAYKANRKEVPTEDQEHRDSAHDLAARFLALCAIGQNTIHRREADDVIAAAWAHVRPEDADKIVILSSDKDFLQLVGPNPFGVETELVRLSSAGTPTDRWTALRVVEELDYAPEEWPLITALAGDASDGVPGVPGIGPKRALKLLRAAEWQLSGLAIPEEHRQIADVCFQVVNLRAMGRDLRPRVPRWIPTRQDSVLWPDLIGFLSAYQMISVKDRLQAGELWSVRDPATVTLREQIRNGRP